MRNLVWILVAAAVLVGGYMLFTGKSVDEITAVVTDAIEQPEPLQEAADTATEEAAEAVDATQDAASEAAETASQAADEAVDATQDAVSSAVEGAVEAAQDTVDAAQQAVEEAVTAADPAAGATSEGTTADDTQATETAQETAPATTEGANDATTDAAPQAAPETAPEAPAEPATTDAAQTPEALTVGGFDFDKVAQMIDESQLGDMQKTLLKGTLDQARNNPDLLEQALASVREALGL